MNRKRWSALLAAIAAAVGGGFWATQPSPPVTPPAPLERAVAFTVWTAPGQPLPASGDVSIETDEPRTVPCHVREDRGWQCPVAPEVPAPYGATLRIAAAGFLPYASRFELARAGIQGLGDIVLQPVPPPVAPSAGREHGFLARAGMQLRTEDGRTWRYAGYTAFPLARQFCGGEDVGPFVDEAAAVGANTLRVLGMYDGGLGRFRLAVEDVGRYDQCIVGLARLLQAKQLRLEFVVFADAQTVMSSQAQQLAHVARVATLLGGEWNVLFELCNECEKNGVDPAAFTKPSTRALWSRGSGLGAGDPAHPAWDVATYHEARDADYPRKNECRPYMTDDRSPIKGVPCLQNEPIGAAEVEQPGRRAGARGADGGAAAVRDFTQMGAVFGLMSPGGLFHSDAGIAGALLGPVQRAMAVGFFQGLHFAPTDAQGWAYQRGDNCGDCDGVGGMPLAQRDLPDPNGTLRTFCRGNGSSEWCVEVRRVGGAPSARAGWRIIENPGPGLIKLTR